MQNKGKCIKQVNLLYLSFNLEEENKSIQVEHDASKIIHQALEAKQFNPKFRGFPEQEVIPAIIRAYHLDLLLSKTKLAQKILYLL